MPAEIVAGQGVFEYEIQYLRAALRAHAEGVRIRPSATERVSRGIAHKHREHNVLLADLEHTGPDTYEANLRLHTDNELLQDHQTGQHVQGIVIIEALRQMFIATFEAAHGLRMADQDFYVVWDSMQIEFATFLFPLPARIRCTIVSADLTDPTRIRLRVDMEITQSGVTAARAAVSYGDHDSARIRSVETPARRVGRAEPAQGGRAGVTGSAQRSPSQQPFSTSTRP